MRAVVVSVVDGVVVLVVDVLVCLIVLVLFVIVSSDNASAMNWLSWYVTPESVESVLIISLMSMICWMSCKSFGLSSSGKLQFLIRGSQSAKSLCRRAIIIGCYKLFDNN